MIESWIDEILFIDRLFAYMYDALASLVRPKIPANNTLVAIKCFVFMACISCLFVLFLFLYLMQEL